jgi:hypothetical protein
MSTTCANAIINQALYESAQSASDEDLRTAVSEMSDELTRRRHRVRPCGGKYSDHPARHLDDCIDVLTDVILERRARREMRRFVHPIGSAWYTQDYPLDPEWLALSDQEKRDQLDSDIDDWMGRSSPTN